MDPRQKDPKRTMVPSIPTLGKIPLQMWNNYDYNYRLCLYHDSAFTLCQCNLHRSPRCCTTSPLLKYLTRSFSPSSFPFMTLLYISPRKMEAFRRLFCRFIIYVFSFLPFFTRWRFVEAWSPDPAWASPESSLHIQNFKPHHPTKQLLSSLGWPPHAKPQWLVNSQSSLFCWQYLAADRSLLSDVFSSLAYHFSSWFYSSAIACSFSNSFADSFPFFPPSYSQSALGSVLGHLFHIHSFPQWFCLVSWL